MSIGHSDPTTTLWPSHEDNNVHDDTFLESPLVHMGKEGVAGWRASHWASDWQPEVSSSNQEKEVSVELWQARS